MAVTAPERIPATPPIITFPVEIVPPINPMPSAAAAVYFIVLWSACL